MCCIQVGGEINYIVEFYMIAEIHSAEMNGIYLFSLLGQH